ncbi:unnamed protein product [Parascedosporium putredinis]|uniref:Efficient mitochondria targeting-associated protein 19 n=1 Tax=Parascedosporium putredinis TaxID=1442378 RepID=A0A9P1H3I2_9PEZI|nr:unnamed protein product [Parascedosporium putredinis]CAI7995173.1 unnamed protein product [Parascedosporium putredinis]
MAATTTTRNWRDYLYLAFFSISFISMFLVDLVEFQPTFFRLFTTLELVYQLPAAFWILRRFSRDGRRPTATGKTGGTTPALELMCLVYGVQCALTTLTCIYDCWHWEGELYTWDVKKQLIFNLYMPWFIIPLGMSLDMYTRLLGRLNGQDGGRSKVQ